MTSTRVATARQSTVNMGLGRCRDSVIFCLSFQGGCLRPRDPQGGIARSLGPHTSRHHNADISG